MNSYRSFKCSCSAVRRLVVYLGKFRVACLVWLNSGGLCVKFKRDYVFPTYQEVVSRKCVATGKRSTKTLNAGYQKAQQRGDKAMARLLYIKRLSLHELHMKCWCQSRRDVSLIEVTENVLLIRSLYSLKLVHPHS